MKQLAREFKDFAMRGNVVDMAVGIILGGAFGKIVSSFVSDVLMPPLGFLLGKVDFSNLYINLSSEQFSSLADAKKAGAPTINIGLFTNTIIDFVIMAFSIFLVIRTLNRFKRQEAPAPTTRECPFCLSAIPVAAKKCAHCASSL